MEEYGFCHVCLLTRRSKRPALKRSYKRHSCHEHWNLKSGLTATLSQRTRVRGKKRKKTHIAGGVGGEVPKINLPTFCFENTTVVCFSTDHTIPWLTFCQTTSGPCGRIRRGSSVELYGSTALPNASLFSLNSKKRDEVVMHCDLVTQG